MLGSALVLAAGGMLLAAVRLSGNPAAYGLVVLVGIVLVGIGCAMHLGAIVDALEPVFGPWRVAAKLTAWLAIGGATVWLIGRAPGDEVLTVLLAAPALLGLAGLFAARTNRWPAIPFLTVAALLIVFFAPLWVRRLLDGQ